MRVMCSSDRPMRLRCLRRSRAEPACPASTSVISSPSTSRYACAPMSRTTWTFGRTSTGVNARRRPRAKRVLRDERPPQQIGDAGHEEQDEDLPEAGLIEAPADRDPRHERDEHWDACDHPEGEKLRREEPKGGVR